MQGFGNCLQFQRLGRGGQGRKRAFQAPKANIADWQRQDIRVTLEVMKVEGPGKSQGTKGVSKTGAKKATGDSSFSGLIDDSDEVEGQKSVSGVMNVGQLDALLSLQESGGGTSEEAM